MLKASGESAFLRDDSQGHGDSPPNSLTILIVAGRADAANSAYAAYINNAGAIFIGGGYQDDYIAWWTGTAVGDALTAKSATWSQATGCCIAGASAATRVLARRRIVVQ